LSYLVLREAEISVGEQYVDLFAAGAYALEAKLLGAFAQPSMAWVFYVLAAAGIITSILQSTLEGTNQLWLRHLATVALASVLILMPHRIDLSDLTYAAPGTVEKLFDTRIGAAPHITYFLERFGSIVTNRVHDLMHNKPVLSVPSIASQTYELASDPATLNDPQLKANLQAWRECIVPRLLSQNPQLAAMLRKKGLVSTLLNPAPSDATWVGSEIAGRAEAVRGLLASSGFDFVAAVADESTFLSKIMAGAGAEPWVVGADSVRISLTPEQPPTVDPPTDGSPAYYDAIAQGTALAQLMTNQLPLADLPVDLTRIEQLYDMLGRSILYTAGVKYMRDDSRLAIVGNHCQRMGQAACRRSQAQLLRASTALRAPASDQYNAASLTTWLKQPIATVLLAVAALLLSALSSLVVAVLPFLLGTAKAIAILMSTIGLWMMLWPGRLRDAISWMVLPVAFVALWGLLFNLWSDLESFLSAIGSIVGHSDYGSFSAGRIMSVAISVGYLGLPAVALSILSGNALRALNHAGARLETALLIAWRTRRTFVSAGRRWLTNSPMARRWNQRAYRAVGLGSLRASRPPTPRAQRSGAQAAPAVPAATAGAPAAPPVARKTSSAGRAKKKSTSKPPDDSKLE
jgi:hypothetical protein